MILYFIRLIQFTDEKLRSLCFCTCFINSYESHVEL